MALYLFRASNASFKHGVARNVFICTYTYVSYIFCFVSSAVQLNQQIRVDPRSFREQLSKFKHIYNAFLSIIPSLYTMVATHSRSSHRLGQSILKQNPTLPKECNSLLSPSLVCVNNFTSDDKIYSIKIFGSGYHNRV